MGNRYPSDWSSRRKKVYSRDNYTCRNCGAKGGSRGNAELHAHHMVPKSNGGVDDLSNLGTFCKECHNAIHGDVDAPTKTSQTRSKREIYSSGGTEMASGRTEIDIDTTEVTRPWEADNDLSEWYLSNQNKINREITPLGHIAILVFILLLVVSVYWGLTYGQTAAIKLYMILSILYVLSLHFVSVDFLK